MSNFYLDTSALIKHYHEEAGTDAMNFLLNAIISGKATGIISSLVLPETISSINRKKNEGFIEKSNFEKILSVFYEELKYFKILPIDEQKIISAVSLILKHNLNSADALHLTSALSEKHLITPGEDYFFVCCDKRLLIAAKKEKLKTLNPEEIGEKQYNKLL